MKQNLYPQIGDSSGTVLCLSLIEVDNFYDKNPFILSVSDLMDLLIEHHAIPVPKFMGIHELIIYHVQIHNAIIKGQELKTEHLKLQNHYSQLKNEIKELRRKVFPQKTDFEYLIYS